VSVVVQTLRERFDKAWIIKAIPDAPRPIWQVYGDPTRSGSPRSWTWTFTHRSDGHWAGTLEIEGKSRWNWVEPHLQALLEKSREWRDHTRRTVGADAVVNALRKRPDLLVAVRQALNEIDVISPWTEEATSESWVKNGVKLVRRTVPEGAYVAQIRQMENDIWTWTAFNADNAAIGSGQAITRLNAIDAADDLVRDTWKDALLLEDAP